MRISLSFQLTRITAAILLLVFFLPGAQASDLTEGLMVDFTNRESRSISLQLGSADGITAEMNFAVIDSAGIQIVEFFPQEILMDRFWSGPFDQEKFARMRTGDSVVTIKLNPEEAAQLRKQFQGRTVHQGKKGAKEDWNLSKMKKQVWKSR